MSDQTSKIAFIGCGNIAHVHMRFLKLAGHAVSAVCDSSTLRCDLFADRYGIEKRYSDVEKLLTHEHPTAVHILTPPHTHYPLILKALNAGSNVLCEKPLCQSSEEYREIAALAARKGLVVSVDHTRVYNPMIRRARERLLSGEIGAIVRMEYDYDDPSVIKGSSGRGHRWARGVPAWFEKIRGGVVADLLPHPLSVFLSFDPGLRIQHVHSHSLAGGIVDELTVLLASETSTALMNLSLNQKPLKNVFTIYGQKGSMRIDLRNMFCVFHRDRKLPGIVSRMAVALGEAGQTARSFVVNVFNLLRGRAHTYDGLDGIMKDFYAAVAAGKSGELPLVNTGKVTALVDEILDASLGQTEASPKPSQTGRPSPPGGCVVFGGSGFIGRRIIDSLLARGGSVTAFCRSARNAGSFPPSVGVALGDLRDVKAVSEALEGAEAVVHCAAAMSGDWAEFHESTVKGTQNVLSAITENSVRKLIYISSLGVLDYNRLKDGGKVDESSAVERKPADRGFYTRAKVEAEELVLQFAASHQEVKVVILRPGLVYGRESNNNLQNCGILLDKFLLVFGLGQRRLGLTYVENLAEAVALAAEADVASGSIIQIVDPDQPTVRSIIERHNSLSGEEVIPLYIPITVWKLLFAIVDLLLLVKDKKAGTFRYRFASNAKTLDYRCDAALNDLGWLPRYDTAESFARTYGGEG